MKKSSSKMIWLTAACVFLSCRLFMVTFDHLTNFFWVRQPLIFLLLRIPYNYLWQGHAEPLYTANESFSVIKCLIPLQLEVLSLIRPGEKAVVLLTLAAGCTWRIPAVANVSQDSLVGALALPLLTFIRDRTILYGAHHTTGYGGDERLLFIAASSKCSLLIKLTPTKSSTHKIIAII